MRGEETGIVASSVAVGERVNAHNIKQCLGILKERDWSGVLIVETEGTELAERSLQWIRRVIGED